MKRIKYILKSLGVTDFGGLFEIISVTGTEIVYKNAAGETLITDTPYDTEIAGDNAEIVTFTVPGQSGTTVINSGAATVDITVPFGTVVTTLVPTITVSAGASVSPVSGLAQNFTSPTLYSVTADDGVTIKTWSVTVTVRENPDKDLLTFSVAEMIGSSVIDHTGFTVAFDLSASTILTGLTTTYTVSPTATGSPTSPAVINYTSTGVTFRVTAADSTEQIWTANRNIV